MGNCGGTQNKQPISSPNEIRINEIPISITQIKIEPLHQKSSDDSFTPSTQPAHTEMNCSTPEIDEEIIQSIEETYSAPILTLQSTPQISSVDVPTEVINPSPSPPQNSRPPLQIEIDPTPQPTTVADEERIETIELPHSDATSNSPPNDRDSIERIESLFSDPPTPRQLAAAQRIQRLARTKSAWRLAEVEREWKVKSLFLLTIFLSLMHLPPPLPLLFFKIFNDLDTQDEADMLNLACFMQTLLDWLPDENNPTKSSTSLQNISSIEDEMDDDLCSDLGGGGGGCGSISVDHIHLSIGPETIHGNLYDYMLPKGPITSDVVSKIVNVYKRNGKLSLKSIQKILRIVYKTLKDRPNISEIIINKNEKLTIVGDLHGQVHDLFHILDESGWPSLTNKYIFNGDFVDRGQHGIEVVTILLSLYAAFPNSIYLNRGNHEDHAICCVYGFQKECKEKYNDDIIFGMYVEVFRHLPLFTLVNSVIFIVHGGLFHDVNVKLSDLNNINRLDYTAKPLLSYPECINGLSPSDSYLEYLKQLQRDALWSDPNDMEILAKNNRGSGIIFGPEITKRFLLNNNLCMIIRSHECVRNGFDLPFSGHSKSLLGTIFSASNYCGGNNYGAYLILSLHKMSKNSIPVQGNCNLFYTVYSYQINGDSTSATAGGATSGSGATSGGIKESNTISLYELIIRRKNALLQAFELLDHENIGKINKLAWAEIMQRVTCLKILWLRTISNICPHAIVGNSIDYHLFLNHFTSMASSLRNGNGHDNDNPYEQHGNMLSMDSMYGQRSKLEAVFRYFDQNGDGMISRSEFKLGCDFINTTLPPDQHLKDYDHILTLMDFDQSDSIDINEFFEVSGGSNTVSPFPPPCLPLPHFALLYR
jgi:serine/threonine-protein phosphatase with EF-hands